MACPGFFNEGGGSGGREIDKINQNFVSVTLHILGRLRVMLLLVIS